MLGYQRYVMRGSSCLDMMFVKNAPYLPRVGDRCNTKLGPAIVRYAVFNEIELPNDPTSVAVSSSIFCTLMADQISDTAMVSIERENPGA